MKTHLHLVLAAAVFSTAAVLAANDGGRHFTDTVALEFDEPEKFTDFRISESGGRAEQATLIAELRDEVRRLATAHLPPGYWLALRIRDIDLAGEFEPQRRRPGDVRIVRAVHPPRITLEYAVIDDRNQIIALGERTLTDLAFHARVRPVSLANAHTAIEAELLGDFIRELVRSLR